MSIFPFIGYLTSDVFSQNLNESADLMRTFALVVKGGALYINCITPHSKLL